MISWLKCPNNPKGVVIKPPAPSLGGVLTFIFALHPQLLKDIPQHPEFIGHHQPPQAIAKPQAIGSL